MADKTFIQSIFIDPPVAIARLGGSSAPMDAYEWAQSANPRTEGETMIVPAWSLNVLADGSVEPIMPAEIKLRDGDQIRPVCPFFEVWAMVSERADDPPSAWDEQPLTTGLLQQNGATEAAIRIRVDAKNRKAERRADNSRLIFGTFPAASVRGDRHAPVMLRGVSSPSTPNNQRMIPPGREIPFGSIRVMRPMDQPDPPTAWSEAGIRRDVIRFRFTPARGEFYGPRAASQTTPPAVTPGTHDFLRAGARWWNSPPDGRPTPLAVVVPNDTIDTIDGGEASLGVVDDTCEARMDVMLSLPGRDDVVAHANVFVAPPDFGPDRRPFLSVADELNDRTGDPAVRNQSMNASERDAWVEDLFERIFEVVSLFNVDRYRDRFGLMLPPDRQVTPGIAGDGLPDATRALGAQDELRNPDLEPLARRDRERPLPLSVRARDRHRNLSDIDFLANFVREHKGRIAELVRGAFEIDGIEQTSVRQTMRMPPFMRNSNFNPLTLSAWQYALLMDWVQAEEAIPAAVTVTAAAPEVVARAMPRSAARRRDDVLARIGRRRPR